MADTESKLEKNKREIATCDEKIEYRDFQIKQHTDMREAITKDKDLKLETQREILRQLEETKSSKLALEQELARLSEKIANMISVALSTVKLDSKPKQDIILSQTDSKQLHPPKPISILGTPAPELPDYQEGEPMLLTAQRTMRKLSKLNSMGIYSVTQTPQMRSQASTRATSPERTLEGSQTSSRTISPERKVTDSEWDTDNFYDKFMNSPDSHDSGEVTPKAVECEEWVDVVVKKTVVALAPAQIAKPAMPFASQDIRYMPGYDSNNNSKSAVSTKPTIPKPVVPKSTHPKPVVLTKSYPKRTPAKQAPVTQSPFTATTCYRCDTWGHISDDCSVPFSKLTEAQRYKFRKNANPANEILDVNQDRMATQTSRIGLIAPHSSLTHIKWNREYVRVNDEDGTWVVQRRSMSKDDMDKTKQEILLSSVAKHNTHQLRPYEFKMTHEIFLRFKDDELEVPLQTSHH